MSLTQEEIKAYREKYGVQTQTTTQPRKSLSPEQIQQYRQKYGVQAQIPSQQAPVAPQATPEPSKSFYQEKIVEPGAQFSEGFAKELVSFGRNLGRGTQGAGQRLMALPSVLPGGKTYKERLGEIEGTTGIKSISNKTPEGQFVKDTIIPEGTAQQAGATTAKVAEFFLPAGVAGKAEKAVDATIAAKGFLPTLGRIFGKSAVQGGAAGGVSYVQSGGDSKEALTSALISGGVRGALATAGEVARATGIPEKIYTRVFKNSKAEMLDELKGDGLVAFAKANPDEYADLVKQGIIQTTDDGAPVLNKTLAEKALDRGLKGDLRTMSNKVVADTFRSEAKVREALNKAGVTIDLPEKQFVNVLQNISDDYADVGFGEIAQKADDILATINKGNGKVDGMTALEFRRLLDSARNARSFDVATTNMSLSQQNLKTLADTVRKRLANVDEVAGIMDDYSFNLEAIEALASEAKRLGNKNILGLLDTLYIGGGAATGSTAPVAVGALSKVLQSPRGLTGLGSAINNPLLGPLGSGVLGNVAGKISEVITPKSDQQR